MRIIIHPHAREHGLSDEQIIHAYETGANGAVIRNRDVTTDPQRWGTVGFDNQAREVELVFVKLAFEAVLVLHANWATPAFKTEIRRARHGRVHRV